MAVTYQIKVDNSGKFKAAMKKQAMKALEECGLIAEGYAQRLCPVDTGNLRNSITHKVVDEKKELACYIGTNVEYAPYIEFGTGIYYDGGRRTEWVYQDDKGEWHRTNGQKAKPFLRPAVTEHKKEYQDIIKEELKN